MAATFHEESIGKLVQRNDKRLNPKANYAGKSPKVYVTVGNKFILLHTLLPFLYLIGGLKKQSLNIYEYIKFVFF